MPNCNLQENLYVSLKTYADTKWNINPLLRTDGRYLYTFLYGALVEDDLPKLEDFLCAHLFPYKQNIPSPYFAPKRRHCCSCTAKFHMDLTVNIILYQYEKETTRHEFTKFTDFPEMAENKYCRRTCYAYYSIDKNNVVTSYLPRNELKLDYPEPEACYPYKYLPKLNNYYYGTQYRNDI